MIIPTRPKSRPINSPAFTAGIFASAAAAFWNGDAGILQNVLAIAALGAGALFGGRALGNMAADYRLRRDLWNATKSTESHGKAREGTWDEVCDHGLDDPRAGMLVGVHQSGKPLFARAPWSLIEAPPGAGKTVNFVIGEVLHQARLGRSLFVPDPKMELAPMLAPALRALGFEVQCINPTKEFPDLCPATEINPYQPVLDAVHAPDAFRQDAAKLANDLAELHLPEEPGGDQKNRYFRNGSRRAIAICILGLALFRAGECTPSDVFATLNDPAAFEGFLLFLRYEADKLRPNDPIAKFLRSEAANLLERKAENSENFSAFLEGATQTLVAFNQGGRLAGYGSAATANIADMRERQIIAFVMSPLSHQREFAPLVSLLNYGLIEAAKRMPRGHPVHLVGEEFLNYRFADFTGQMETLRGLRVSATLYVQSYQGLVRKFGREAAASIEAYSDLRIYVGLNSLERARHVSDMLAEGTVRDPGFSFDVDASKVSMSSRERAKRLMAADEILAMPKDEAWAFVRGMRPMRVKMVSYGQISPWRDEVGNNPLEGTRLRGETLVTLSYPAQGSDAPIGMASSASAPKRPRSPSAPWPVRPRHLLWLPMLTGLWFGTLTFGTPHLRFDYDTIGTGAYRTITHCTYVGIHGIRPSPTGSSCELVSLIPSTKRN